MLAHGQSLRSDRSLLLLLKSPNSNNRPVRLSRSNARDKKDAQFREVIVFLTIGRTQSKPLWSRSFRSGLGWLQHGTHYGGLLSNTAIPQTAMYAPTRRLLSQKIVTDAQSRARFRAPDTLDSSYKTGFCSRSGKRAGGACVTIVGRGQVQQNLEGEIPQLREGYLSLRNLTRTTSQNKQN